MSTKKKAAGSTAIKSISQKKDDSDAKYQILKGIQYERPKYYGVGPDGSKGWFYDVDGYPSDGSVSSGQ